MKERGGNKTARTAEGRDGDRWDWSWEACSGWREHEEIDVVKRGCKEEGAFGTGGRMSERQEGRRKKGHRMDSERKGAVETLTFCIKLKNPK